MRYPIVIAGIDIKEQMAPYYIYNNMRWNDVTEIAKKNWRECKGGSIMSFEEFLSTFHSQWDSIPDVGIQGMNGYIKKNGHISVFYYGNLQGHWSTYADGKMYKNFFLLKNGKSSWRARAGQIDFKSDIEILEKRSEERWQCVQDELTKAAESGQELPLYHFATQSRAGRMNKDDYVKKVVAETITPDALVLNAKWIELRVNS